MNQDTSREDPFTAQTHARGCRRFLTVASAVMLLACGGCFYRIVTFWSAAPVEIGPQTTVIEEPQFEDGRIDYVTALNERMSEGVTPDNNAAVLLLQAFGPEIIPSEHRSTYLDQLEISDTPLDGEHVIGQIEWAHRDVPPGTPVDAERELAIQDQFGAAMERGWTREEFPEVAGWLEANESPLELIVAATGRPRLYSPLIGDGDPPLISSLSPLQQEARSAARLLTARAMLRLGEGDVDGAWDDLLACHRLARLIGQGETLINDLVAVAISAMACAGSETLALDDRLTAEQARRCASDLAALPPLPEFSATVDVGERYAMLDAFQSMAQGKGTAIAPGMQAVAGRGFDWGLMMQLANERYDEYVEAFSQEDYPARLEHLEELDAQIKAAAPGGMSAPQLISMALIGSRRQVSSKLSDLLLALLAPAISQCSIAETRAETRVLLLRIALMLAEYQVDHGAFPESLEELAPDYLATVPLDPFSEAPFQYEQTETGYRLYSVGDNMTDDGGLTYDSEPRGDDIIIESPEPSSESSPQPSAEAAVERRWFVSPDGDDAADGSESAPVRTLAAALDKAQSGDTIELSAGVYAGEVQTRRHGVTIAGPKEAIIRGPDDERGIEILHDDTVLRGFTIERVDIAVWVYGADHCVLQDLQIQDIGGEGVRIRNGSSENIVRGCQFERMGLEGFDVAAGRKNGEGVYIGTAPEQRDGNDPPNVPDRCTGNIVEDCIFDTEAAEAVDIKEDSEENIVRRCHAEDSRDPDGGVFGSRGDRNQFIECIALGGRGHGFRFGGDTVEAGQFGQEESRIYGKNNVMRNCHAEINGHWGAAPMVWPQDIDDSNTWLDNADGPIRPPDE